MSLLNRALTSGTVSQRADSSDELEQRSTPHADKLMDELLALGYYPKARGADQPFQLRLSRVKTREKRYTEETRVRQEKSVRLKRKERREKNVTLKRPE